MVRGSPEDRGNADYYYGRMPSPHKIVDGKEIRTLTCTEIAEYYFGYTEAETYGDRKDYGDYSED